MADVLSKADSTFRFQLEEVGVGINAQKKIIETGFTSLRVFAGLEESRAVVRKALKSTFGFDAESSPEMRKEVALLCVWEAARTQLAYQEKNKQEAKLGTQNRLVQNSEYGAMRAALENSVGKLRDTEQCRPPRRAPGMPPRALELSHRAARAVLSLPPGGRAIRGSPGAAPAAGEKAKAGGMWGVVEQSALRQQCFTRSAKKNVQYPGGSWETRRTRSRDDWQEEGSQEIVEVEDDNQSGQGAAGSRTDPPREPLTLDQARGLWRDFQDLGEGDTCLGYPAWVLERLEATTVDYTSMEVTTLLRAHTQM